MQTDSRKIEGTLKDLVSYAKSSLEPAPLTMEVAKPIALNTMENKFHFPLTCQRSGLLIGDFYPSSGLAKNTPYVAAWKQTTFLHPVFSMDLRVLITRATACWQLEKAGIRQYPMRDKQLLFLAMLHASDLIKQDVAGLPSPRITETHFPRLIELLSWKQDTGSSRISFPKLHVWKGAVREDENNIFATVPAWLDVCEVCRDEYENTARERMKKAKQKAHEAAMKSIRKSMYSDISLKRLWNWVSSQVPQTTLENNPDIEQLFFCEEHQVHFWTKEDIGALETVFLKYCELGSSVSHEVNKRIQQLFEWLKVYEDTFTIVEDDSRFSEYRGTDAPKAEKYASRAAFLVAQAKWQLANKGSSQQPTKKDDKL